MVFGLGCGLVAHFKVWCVEGAGIVVFILHLAFYVWESLGDGREFPVRATDRYIAGVFVRPSVARHGVASLPFPDRFPPVAPGDCVGGLFGFELLDQLRVGLPCGGLIVDALFFLFEVVA